MIVVDETQYSCVVSKFDEVKAVLLDSHGSTLWATATALWHSSLVLSGMQTEVELFSSGSPVAE